MSRLLVAIALCSLLGTAVAHAADVSDSQEEGHEHHHHHTRWAISISPRYYGLNTNGYASAFTGNGFSGPKSGTIGLDMSVYWLTKTDWQLGFGLGNLGYTNDLGSSEASYSQDFFGFWLAKQIPLAEDWDLSVGALFAGGTAQVEVLSSSANGRVDEGAFILEPKVIAAYRASPWFKVGVSGSYLEPLAQTDSVKGNNVTTGNISIHGFSGGVEFIFGHFDLPKNSE